MAYNVEKITKLGHLKDLALRIKEGYATQEEVDAINKKIDSIVAEGGEPNIIEVVKVNGTALEVVAKAVDVLVPENMSDLVNDEDFLSSDEIEEAIEKAISETGHASFKIVDEVPDPAEAEENVMYMVKNEETGYYDIYVLVDGEMVLIDDTSVDLDNYVTKEDLEETLDETLEDYVTKEDMDVTEEGEGNVVTKVAYNKETGIFTVTKGSTALLTTDVATDDEVEEMLDEVFGE